MKLLYLKAHNLGTFQELHIDADALLKTTALSNCMVLTGRVGSGKTLCLTAIAMGVLASLLTDNAIERLLPVTNFDSNPMQDDCTLMKVEAKYLTIGTHKKDKNPIFTVKTMNKVKNCKSKVSSTGKNDQELLDLLKDKNRCFMLAYGPKFGEKYYGIKDVEAYSTDWVKRNAMRLEGILGPKNERLVPLEVWLKPLKTTDNTRYIEVVNLINELLGISDYWFSGNYCRQSGEYLFEYKGTDKCISKVSTGTNELLGFVNDLVFHIHQSTSSTNQLKNITGMILIDQFERNFDKHIKSSFLPLLCKLLPNIQFIVTTHSDEVLDSVTGAAKLRLNIDKTRSVH